MPLYRAYVIENGQVWTAVDLACVDDDDAKRQSEGLLVNHDIELWERDRKVAVMISKNPGRSSTQRAPLRTDAWFSQSALYPNLSTAPADPKERSKLVSPVRTKESPLAPNLDEDGLEAAIEDCLARTP
ncbi:MAG: hypothetical protein JO283_16575 [Bradyrhizobium sp.]|nr:hypothetical protein [Bradyrhizobium sp.]